MDITTIYGHNYYIWTTCDEPGRIQELTPDVAAKTGSETTGISSFVACMVKKMVKIYYGKISHSRARGNREIVAIRWGKSPNETGMYRGRGVSG